MAGQPLIFRGQGFSLQRDKNRFVLPVPFRGVLKELSEGLTVCFNKHERWPCLKGYGLNSVEGFEKQIADEKEAALRLGRDFDEDKRASELYSDFQAPFDTSGRFVMPEDCVSLADLGDELFFLGGGKFFTVWNPEHLYEMDESWDAAKTACRNYAERERAKASRK
ncbi:division/cell wall cluster transcriptional repressor MraZ [Novosphingobium sp. PC22D]|uniref:division/cell wall cluster transcriptional repressor MraZ n=1 Tax=Novosphingobium sp. PC22D TaxID=1962403 RepID=UPI000BF0590B|nr:division/cell wall cluster transcriptional repressor MraZ [Novosphingobium sp. PC22D]PEQ12659.1 division/cell wall cluster transcriptional repressor MraZ [Novosphingobium sp. PC22D]